MSSSIKNPQPQVTTEWRWQPGRRGFPLRRRKVQIVQLGGEKPAPRTRRMAAALRNNMKVRWVKLQYICMMKKVREYYRKLVKDMAEAGASIEQFQQRLFMESTFAIPVGGFTTYPSRI